MSTDTRTRIVSVRLSHAQIDFIDQAGKGHRMTRSHTVRNVIADWIEAETAKSEQGERDHDRT